MARWSTEVVLDAPAVLVTPFVARNVHVQFNVKGALGIVVGFVFSGNFGFDSGNRTVVGLVRVRHGGC